MNNFLSLGLSTAILYIFTQVLLPIYQKEMDPKLSAANQSHLYNSIRLSHQVMTGVVLAIMVLQVKEIHAGAEKQKRE